MCGRARHLLFFVLGFFPWSLYALNDMELIKLIDQRKYQAVINHFPAQPNGTEANLVFKAHAQLGLAGFEPLALINRIRVEQTVTDKLLQRYFERCENVVLGKKLQGPVKCVVLRLFNQIPHHALPMLLAARNTFGLIHSKGLLGRQDRFLYSIVELSAVLSKLREVLFMYDALNENKVSYNEAREIIEVMRSAGQDFENFVNLYKDPDIAVIFNRHFFGSKDSLLLGMDIDGKVQFLEKSGLPTFFKVTDMEKEETLQLAGRNIIIKIIDRADNFFRTQ